MEFIDYFGLRGDSEHHGSFSAHRGEDLESNNQGERYQYERYR